jgi:hypothetical protein
MTRAKSAKQLAKKARSEVEQRIDEESEQSFPASDPPSFAGGQHAVGEPWRPKDRKHAP